MPFHMDRHGKVIQLAISSGNFLILLCGLLWAIAIFYGDTKTTDRQTKDSIAQIQNRVSALEGASTAFIAAVRDGQDKTNARLTTVETQNAFILRALDRLETALSRNQSPN